MPFNCVYLFRKKFFCKRDHNIGDFDLSLRLSNYVDFYHIKKPLTYRRLHKKNESRLQKEKTIKEFDIFYKLNKQNKEIFTNETIKVYQNSNLIRKILFF